MAATSQDLKRAVDGIERAAKRVMSFCLDFNELGTSYQYFKAGPKNKVPSELGMTDVFLCSLAFECGRQNKTLEAMSFAKEESTQGYDFMVEFKIDGQLYRCYLQAKCAKLTSDGNEHVEFLAKSSANQTPQWELLRKLVGNDLVNNGFNSHEDKAKVMGMYIVYSKEGVHFIPLGYIQDLFDDDEKNKWFDGKPESLVAMWKEFRGDTTFLDPGIFFKTDRLMELHVYYNWKDY